MKIVFFDLDGTLTYHDTFIGFAKFCVGKKSFIKAFIRSIPSLILWKIGIKSNSYAKQILFSNLYKGMKYSVFLEVSQKFAQSISRDIRKDVFDKLKYHKQCSHRIAIVSASIGDWIRPWAQKNGIDEVIATEIEVDERGVITGHFSTPNCYGKEKENRIRKLVPQIDKYESWAYGDSSGDYYLLSLVNHGFRVTRRGVAEIINRQTDFN